MQCSQGLQIQYMEISTWPHSISQLMLRCIYAVTNLAGSVGVVWYILVNGTNVVPAADQPANMTWAFAVTLRRCACMTPQHGDKLLAWGHTAMACCFCGHVEDIAARAALRHPIPV